jgi:hypothetical protein
MQQSESGAWEVVDLCRLPLEDAGGVSQLQILADHGQFADEQHLLETLEAVDGSAYRSIFTDAQALQGRLASWRSSDWIVPLLRRLDAAGTSPPASTTIDADAVHEPTERSRLWDRARANWSELWSHCSNTQQRTSPSGAASPREASDRAALRQVYLQAKQQHDQLRQQISALRDQLQNQQSTLVLLDQAIRVKPIWDQLQAIDSRRAGAHANWVLPQDVQQLRQLSRRISLLRQQRQRVLERLTAPPPPRRKAEQPDPRCISIQTLLDTWPACQEQYLRTLQIRSQLAHQATVHQTSDVQAILAEARLAISQVRSAARALREARHVPRVAQPATDAQPASAEPDDLRIESLRRQIRQLREESRRLLDRQLLSRQALFGVGLLFASGMAILLAALTLNLDGANLGVGAIGLTCLLAAALLKSSFERTPAYQLRRQRLRISALFAQLEETGDLYPRREATSETDGALPGMDEPDVVSQLAASKQAWLATLARWDLAEDLSAPAAVRHLRNRMRKRLAVVETSNRDALSNQLTDAQAQVDDWCRRAAEQLNADAHSLATQSPKQLFRQLQVHQRQLVTGASPTVEANSSVHQDADARKSLREMQQSLRQLIQRKRAILDRCGLRGMSDLRQRLQDKKCTALAEAERARLQQQLESSLPDEPERAQLCRWFEQSNDLESERERRQQEMAQTQRLLTSTQQELVQQQAELDQVTRRPEPFECGPAPAAEPFTCDIHSRNEKVLALTGAVFNRLTATSTVATPAPSRPPKLDAGGQPPLLQLATNYLRLLWNDDSVAVGWDDAAMGPYVLHPYDIASSFDDLSADKQLGLGISLQLSLVRCLTQRIGHLPLVLTDRTLADADAQPNRRIAELLCHLAGSGQQILVVTATGAVGDLFRLLDVPTLTVVRKEHDIVRSVVRSGNESAD